jgi:hypothetical protein
MNKIMEELEKRFAGQAAARLDTYAGKMDALKKSTDEATKIIGEGLIDALDILSEDETVTDLSEAMENFAENTAAATKAIAKLAKGFNDFTSSPSFKPAILAFTLLYARKSGNFNSFKAALVYVGASGAIELATKDFGRGSSQFGGTRQLSKDLMITKLLNKARKEEFDVIAKKNAIENKNVEELKKKFDLERIGLTAALNQATDDETRIRLKAQLAILDNNEALAKKLLAEMEAIDALKRLADAANKAAEALSTHPDKYDQMITTLIDQFKALGLTLQESMALAAMSARYQAQVDAIDRGTPATATPQNLPESGFRYDPLSGLRPTDQDIRITVDTAGSGDKLSQAIAESIQIATRSGYSTHLLGSYDSTCSKCNN